MSFVVGVQEDEPALNRQQTLKINYINNIDKHEKILLTCGTNEENP